MTLSTEDEMIVLDVTGPAGARPVIDAMFPRDGSRQAGAQNRPQS
jgi:hypothetical protein